MSQATPQLQGLPPLLHAKTRLVVLGSFPGVASLRAQQYYGHPYNQFWKIVATLLATDTANATVVMAMPYADRAQWLLRQGVGLWDVYAACEREGSLDMAIQHAQLNDVQSLRTRCPHCRRLRTTVAKASNTPSTRGHWACRCTACHPPVRRTPVGRLNASSPLGGKCFRQRACCPD